MKRQTVVMLPVRASNQLLMLLPKIATTPISSTATSATSSPYSVTAIPSSDFTKRDTASRDRRMVIIRIRRW